MSEENKENLNENVQETEQNETVEETVEETADVENEETANETSEDAENVVSDPEEKVQETASDTTDTAADSIEGAEAIDGEPVSDGIEAAEVQKKPKTGLIVGIVIAAVVVAAAIILAVVFGKNLFNKYNRMGYVDVSGRTIAQIADESGYELADFLAQYDLPADMPGSTFESAAYYNIPCKKIAEMYGMDFANLKEMLKLGDDITEDTTWGVAEGETTVGSYVGEDNLDEFKKQYGFGDEVTAETKMKEIRKAMDQQSRDARIASEKAQKEAEQATDAPADATATDAPADATATDDAGAAADTTAATDAPAADKQ